MAELTAETTFDQWYGEFGPAHVGPNITYNMHHIGETTGDAAGYDIFQLRKDVFLVPKGEHGETEPRMLVAAYALYRKQILKLGGVPSEYVRP